MAGAAYDGSAVDARAYRDAQNDYTQAAASLERYLSSQCPTTGPTAPVTTATTTTTVSG